VIPHEFKNFTAESLPDSLVMVMVIVIMLFKTNIMNNI